jgi:hypothetical protein
MKRFIALAILGISLNTSIQAQQPFDALRFSMLGPGGTARYLSAAGAFGAIGADFSSLSTNPAGIGLYRTTEFSFTPGLNHAVSDARYGGMNSEDDNYQLAINNAGVVFAFGKKPSESSNWKRIQFGFGMNRVADYNDQVTIEGDNANTSVIMALQKKATGIMPADLNTFDTKLAWDTYLFKDTVRSSNNVLQYTSVVPDGGVRQIKYIEKSGCQNEMVMTLGGNYNDKLFIGGTFGFPTIRYREDGIYREVDTGDSISGFKSLTMNDYLYTTGSGINFKFGLIAKPFNWLRIGWSIHTPTFFNMHDEYSTNMKHQNDAGQELIASSPQGIYDYQLRTPMRSILSIGFVIKQFGFIGIDYESVDYSDAKFETNNSHFSEVNRIIHEDYNAASNVRIGGELNLKQFKLRAGYAIYTSPYKNNLNDFERNSLTFGLGFRDKNYFLDFAWIMNSYSEEYYLYDPELVLPSSIDHFNSNMIMTIGFKL